ncbi:olfactory receptor 24-like, partial [Sinocyclocheilus rhinocerous]|uniref:olfactory receptor 24-like n=1 Tax=Sinocyclocheilus rhinocerous TaxID=307959 RepID=UPI0007B91EF2
LVAICFPLHYHAVVTKPAMFLIIGLLWILSVTFFSVFVGSMTRLSFCGSNVLDTYFCDYGPIYRLACNDTSLIIFLVKMCYGLLIFTPLILIFISYFCIALVLFKIPHGVDRIKAIKTCTSHLLKAMKTCNSHLMMVAISYLPLISNNIASITTYSDPNTRIINTCLTQTIPPMLNLTIPPMLNPIIYTLKTEEVMQSIKELYKRSKL